MRPLSKREITGVSLILAFVFLLSLFNFGVSIRKSRDAQRKGDLGAISRSLEKYRDDFGFFPPATGDGKILACPKDNFDEIASQAMTPTGLDMEKYFEAFVGCVWGEDKLIDPQDKDHPPYINPLPKDPKDGVIQYLYFSNTKRFQIFAYLEGEHQEDGYNENIEKRNLYCGNAICNFGRSFGETPLDMTIEEYEIELIEKINNY